MRVVKLRKKGEHFTPPRFFNNLYIYIFTLGIRCFYSFNIKNYLPKTFLITTGQVCIFKNDSLYSREFNRLGFDFLIQEIKIQTTPGLFLNIIKLINLYLYKI